MAFSGFRGRTSVVGIDLGTTYSVLAVRATGGGIGKVEVVPDYSNAISTSSPIVPSVVYYPDGRNQNSKIVGRKAKVMIGSDPRNVIYNAKRFIGRDYNDPAVSPHAKFHAFGVVPPPPSNATTPSLSGVAFQLSSSQILSPEEVGSHVVSHLLDNAKKYLGHAQITTAVVAVPAKFNAKQRRATALAFNLAGLKVARMLEEPTAAAIAYGLHRKDNVHHILVYDFGGGTLDVSVLHVSDGYVDVIGSEGDDLLGGADFDRAVGESCLPSTSSLFNSALV